MVFELQDFSVFEDSTLSGRMQGIRTVIDPKFAQLAEKLIPLLECDGQQWYAHIAKHLRRTTNAPENTWVAFAPNKRGYKMLPHYEVGFWDDHVYVYLAVEENMKPDQTSDVIERLSRVRDDIALLPDNYVLSTDHMANVTVPLTLNSFNQAILRFEKVKHSEILIGIKIQAEEYKQSEFDDELIIVNAVTKLHHIYRKIW